MHVLKPYTWPQAHPPDCHQVQSPDMGLLLASLQPAWAWPLLPVALSPAAASDRCLVCGTVPPWYPQSTAPGVLGQALCAQLCLAHLGTPHAFSPKELPALAVSRCPDYGQQFPKLKSVTCWRRGEEYKCTYFPQTNLCMNIWRKIKEDKKERRRKKNLDVFYLFSLVFFNI